MDDAYYRWLIDLLDDDYLRSNYQKLLMHLYQTTYFWEISYDGNRASDGLQLRKYYGKEIGYPDFTLPQACTVLEMLIALARRTENEVMHEPREGDRTKAWFTTMLQNLGLYAYDDFSYDPVAVDYILYVFMHHLYAPDGNGSPFPCYGINTDLRQADLWWQMNQYFLENYPI